MSPKRRPCGCRKKRKTQKTESASESHKEFVEKHLRAARVLISEHRDDDLHKGLIVEHLHKAEDKSQAWPELHKAIRNAKKAYQENGAVPDIEPLVNKLKNVK